MQENNFSQRLCEAMEERNIRQVDIVKAAEQKGIKLGKSHVSQYVSGKTVPRDNILRFLAEYLMVDIDWLNGSSEIELTKKETVVEHKGGCVMNEIKKSSKLNNGNPTSSATINLTS